MKELRELKKLSKLDGKNTTITFYEGGEVSSYWVEDVDEGQPSWHTARPIKSESEYYISDYYTFIRDLKDVAKQYPEVYVRVYNHIKDRKEPEYIELAKHCAKKHNSYIDSLYDFIEKNPKIE